MSAGLEKFTNRYQATVRPSRQFYRRPVPLPVHYDAQRIGYIDPPQHVSLKEIPGVEIVMPEDRFRHMMDMLDKIEEITQGIMEDYFRGKGLEHMLREYAEENRIRHEHPAVAQAYNEYRMLLKLAGG